MLIAYKTIALGFSAVLWYVPVIPWLVHSMNRDAVGEAALSVCHQSSGVADNKNRNATQIIHTEWKTIKIKWDKFRVEIQRSLLETFWLKEAIEESAQNSSTGFHRSKWERELFKWRLLYLEKENRWCERQVCPQTWNLRIVCQEITPVSEFSAGVTGDWEEGEMGNKILFLPLSHRLPATFRF